MFGIFKGLAQYIYAYYAVFHFYLQRKIINHILGRRCDSYETTIQRPSRQNLHRIIAKNKLYAVLVAIQNTQQPSMTIILKDLMYTPLLLGRQKLFSFPSSRLLFGGVKAWPLTIFLCYCTNIHFKKGI